MLPLRFPSLVVTSCSALLLASNASAFTDWYVGPNPNGPGSGTSNDPYRSIQFAIDAPTTVAGDTLHVRAGNVYYENLDPNGKALNFVAWGLRSEPFLPTLDGRRLGACFGASNNEFGTTITGFRFRNGRSSRGGGIFASYASLIVRDCVFEDNEARDFGGGVELVTGGPFRFEHCVFVGNRAQGGASTGGGISVETGFPVVLDHCTFWGNEATVGGGLYVYAPHVSVRNSIVWSSAGGDIVPYIHVPDVAWCDVESGFAGTGNVSGDPLLWNPWGGNFFPNYGSPCIDAGDPASALDPDGTRADIGAFAFAAGNGNEFVVAVPGGASSCASDPADPIASIACPCGNLGALGHGCAHSASALGAVLTAAPASAGEVVLHGYGMPAVSTCIYFKGDQLAAPSVVFGDGARCVSGALVRIGMEANAAGASQYPSSALQDPLSVRSQTPLGSGLVAHYQAYFRNAAAFCTPDTFNATNGYSVTW
ncbi:MAG: right-handed parallel beta-helix repeat-containing protein [Planctomycetota bacterium]